METLQRPTGYMIATVLMATLLGSILAAPTFSAFADKPTITPPVTPSDDHKKGVKDPDSDKDKDNKACKHPDTLPNGKYRHNCDSDNDFKP